MPGFRIGMERRVGTEGGTGYEIPPVGEGIVTVPEERKGVYGNNDQVFLFSGMFVQGDSKITTISENANFRGRGKRVVGFLFSIPGKKNNRQQQEQRFEQPGRSGLFFLKTERLSLSD